MYIFRIWNAETHSKTNSFILEARLAAAELITVSAKLYNRLSEVLFHFLYLIQNTHILHPYEKNTNKNPCIWTWHGHGEHIILVEYQIT